MEDKNSYEKEMERLENIVLAIRDGKVSLSDSIDLFEEGEKLCESLADKLKEFEGKIKVLNEKSKSFDELNIPLSEND